MRGRRPTRTALKLIQGNPGKRALNPNEPKPVTAVPTCPAHLSPTAKSEWKRLAQQLEKLGIISQLDRAAFAAYCQAYGRWVEAERRLAETPTLIKLPSGYIQPSPWLGIANKQLGRIILGTTMRKSSCDDHETETRSSWLTDTSPP